MTAEQVIQAGKIAENTGYSFLTQLQLIVIIFIGLALFFMIQRTEKMRKNEEIKKSLKFKLRDIFLPFTVVIPAFWLLGLFFYEVGEEQDRYREWKNNYVEPYIDSLEPIKIPVVDVNFTGEDAVTVAYFKDDELVRKGGDFEVKVVDSEDDTIYFEYKEVKQDLGRNFTKGLYHEIVYIPKTYKGNVVPE